jgi:hypothetical protein
LIGLIGLASLAAAFGLRFAAKESSNWSTRWASDLASGGKSANKLITMWIVRLALRRPYTFMVMAIVIGTEGTRLLWLRYRNRDRIVELHDYGEHNGVIKLLTWQIAGSRQQPAPQLAMDGDRSHLRRSTTHRTFPGGRTSPSGKHHKWDKLFLTVKSASKNPR